MKPAISIELLPMIQLLAYYSTCKHVAQQLALVAGGELAYKTQSQKSAFLGEHLKKTSRVIVAFVFSRFVNANHCPMETHLNIYHVRVPFMAYQGRESRVDVSNCLSVPRP